MFVVNIPQQITNLVLTICSTDLKQLIYQFPNLVKLVITNTDNEIGLNEMYSILYEYILANRYLKVTTLINYLLEFEIF